VYLFIARQLPLHSTFLHVDAALLGRIITSLTAPTAPPDTDAATAASARTHALEREHALLGLIDMLRPEPAEARRLLALSERAGFFQVRRAGRARTRRGPDCLPGAWRLRHVRRA